MKKSRMKKIFKEQHEMIDELCEKLKATLEENKELRTRLYTITDAPDIQQFTSDDVATVHAEVRQFGLYVPIGAEKWADERIEHAKMAVAEQITEALIAQGLVQFIIKTPGEDNSPFVGTVGAKLMVIPWECGYRHVEDLHPENGVTQEYKSADYTEVCKQPRDKKGRFMRME